MENRIIPESKIAKKISLLIMFLFLFYSGIFIYRTSFVIEGERYFVLMDDAMISMRYAKNLANGYGAVWNPGGDKVQGYTNPLWMLYMAFFHLFPIPDSKISLCIQISGVIFLLIGLIFYYRILLFLTTNIHISLISLFFSAFYYPLILWSIYGMEVSILTCLLLMGLYTLIVKKNYILTYFLLGIGILVRLDFSVVFALVLLFQIMYKEHRKYKSLLYGIVILFFFAGSQFLFSKIYYGDFLPNTYYLKLYGTDLLLRLKRGWFYYRRFLSSVGYVFVLFVLLYLVQKKSKEETLFFLLFIGLSLYSIYVGGDVWEFLGGANRFISPSFPLLIYLIVSSVFFFRSIIIGLTRCVNYVFVNVLTLILLILFFLAANHLFYIYTEEISLDNLTLRVIPFKTIDKFRLNYALYLKHVTKKNAKIATTGAGILPYFVDRYCIDILGKNDRYIACLMPRLLPEKYVPLGYWPGHMKFDYSYSIGKLKPDVVARLWFYGKEARGFLKDYVVATLRFFAGTRFTYYYYLHPRFRIDSKEIIWERLSDSVGFVSFVQIKMPEEGLEPTLPKREADFESAASPGSATPASEE